jgi:uncharacterized protein HemX
MINIMTQKIMRLAQTYTGFLLLGCLILHDQTLAISYPSPDPDSNLTDLSGQLHPEYLGKMSSRLDTYPFEIRAIFLPETQKTPLAAYASNIFRAWRMSSESLILVIALDRRKIGVHVGSKLREKLGQHIQQEFNLPESSSPPGQDTQKPVQNHLEMLPEIIDDVRESLKTVKKNPGDTTTPSAPPPASPLLLTNPVHQNRLTPPPKNSARSMLPFWILLTLSLLTGGLILGVKLWQARRNRQLILGKYALEGQTAYNEIEQLYTRLDQLIPSFHAYQGETQEKLKLYLQELKTVQTHYDDLFDRYEEEVSRLNQTAHTLTTIDFFQELEKSLSKGHTLLTQGHDILKNLEKVKTQNQSQFDELSLHVQRFGQELQQLKQTNPQLRLTKLSHQIQKHHEQLQHMMQNHQTDPIRIEKNIPHWHKKLVRLEREAQALPHLWLQYKEGLSTRLEALRQNNVQHTEQHVRQLNELCNLHKQMLHILADGDLERISDLNERFIKQLHSLEHEL